MEPTYTVQMRELHAEHNLLTSFAGLGDQPHLKHIFLQGNEVHRLWHWYYRSTQGSRTDTVFLGTAVRCNAGCRTLQRSARAAGRPALLPSGYSPTTGSRCARWRGCRTSG